MKFYSQLNTSGREPTSCDTPVSHSINIPTEELKILRSLKYNERADKAAKLAIVERQISNISLPYKDMYSSIDQKVKAKALGKWNTINNMKLRNIKSSITPWSTSLHRNRC